MVYGIVLAGGSGKRLGAEIPKQYIEINGKPLLYYTLKAFEDSFVDEISVVADEAHMRFVVSEIVDKYGFRKVSRVCQGGSERFDSVHHGLDDLSTIAGDDDLVLIHDGARPFIQPEEINRMIGEVKQNGAAIAAMPVKDTIKVSDEEGFVAATTVRANTWQIQTPQAFRYGLIKDAYDKAASMAWCIPKASQEMTSHDCSGNKGEMDLNQQPAAEVSDYTTAGKIFTDDSMVIEAVCPEQKIKLVPISYENVKITTAEDLEAAKSKLS